MLLASTSHKPEILNGLWLIKPYLSCQSHQCVGVILTLNGTKPAFRSLLPLKVSEPQSFYLLYLPGRLFVSCCVQLFSHGICVVINFHSCFLIKWSYWKLALPLTLLSKNCCAQGVWVRQRCCRKCGMWGRKCWHLFPFLFGARTREMPAVTAWAEALLVEVCGTKPCCCFAGNTTACGGRR